MALSTATHTQAMCWWRSVQTLARPTLFSWTMGSTRYVTGGLPGLCRAPLNIRLEDHNQLLCCSLKPVWIYFSYFSCNSPRKLPDLGDKAQLGDTVFLLLFSLWTSEGSCLSPQVLSESFRMDYCRLWQALIKADMKRVQKYSRRLGAGDLYPLFACMLTARSWESVNRGIDQSPVSASEVGLMGPSVLGVLPSPWIFFPCFNHLHWCYRSDVGQPLAAPWQILHLQLS